MLFLALNSCSDEAAAPQHNDTQPTLNSGAGVFAIPGTILEAYEPPADGAWANRYVEHLRVGSKNGHRFAIQRLTEMGPAASATLSREIRAHLASSASMGYLVSLCNAFTTCSAIHDADVLMDLAEGSGTPVVRTAALEAIGRTGAIHLAPRLMAVVKDEPESSPHGAGLNALGKFGTAECIDFLEQQVALWLEPQSSEQSGQQAWNALLLVENPQVAFSLARLEPRLAPFLALQAYGIRIRFGERDLAAKIRPYLNMDQYPSAGTRTLALQLLGELGDWETVLSMQDSEELKIQETVVGLLRQPQAVAAGLGETVLDHFAQNEQGGDLRYSALQALLERGQSQRLDPFLRQVREFPTGKGSMEALLLLSKQGFHDPRTDSILVERWPFAEGSYRTDLLRGLTRSGSPIGARFLTDRAKDPNEEIQLRETAMTILANFGVESVPLFLEIYNNQPGVWTALKVIPGLGKYASQPAARAQLLYFAGSPEVDDRIRQLVIGMLPKIFGAEASDLLLELRDHEPRGEIVKYLNSVLHEYF